MTLKVNPVTLASYGQALTGLRVQAPLGARVLSFVCCAPNDGFGPQSGLVQRGVLYAAAFGGENHTTALRALEMQSPFGGWRHHLARREEIEAALVMGWPLDSVILNAVKNLGAWRG